jgi:hypothetical protein
MGNLARVLLLLSGVLACSRMDVKGQAASCFDFRPQCVDNRLRVCVGGAFPAASSDREVVGGTADEEATGGWIDCSAYCKHLNDASDRVVIYTPYCDPNLDPPWCRCLTAAECPAFLGENCPPACSAESCPPPRQCEGNRCVCMRDGKACLADGGEAMLSLGACSGGSYSHVDCGAYCAALHPGGATAWHRCLDDPETATARCDCAPQMPGPCIPDCRNLECGPPHNLGSPECRACCDGTTCQPGQATCGCDPSVAGGTPTCPATQCCDGHACSANEVPCADCVAGRCSSECSKLAGIKAEARACCRPGPDGVDSVMLCDPLQRARFVACPAGTGCGFRQKPGQGFEGGCHDEALLQHDPAHWSAAGHPEILCP